MFVIENSLKCRVFACGVIWLRQHTRSFLPHRPGTLDLAVQRKRGKKSLLDYGV